MRTSPAPAPRRSPVSHPPASRAMRWLVFLAFALTTIGGCGPLRRTPSVVVRVQGDTQMNYVNERPNAAVVRIYQLTSRANFDRASRAALWRDDSAALGAELVAKHEVTLLPDAQ